MVNLSTVLAGISAGSALAVPVTENREYRLEDIQCRCLTFRSNERPTTCNFLESKGFGWRSAHTLASQYDIQVQLASKSSISKLLSISTPLPNHQVRWRQMPVRTRSFVASVKKSDNLFTAKITKAQVILQDK
jgi:hypothetical protein